MKAFLKRFLKSKRPFQLTRGGLVFILYTIGVGAGAINTGNNLLYLVFGVFLGLILASGVLSDLTLWKLEVKAVFPRSCNAGELCVLPIHLTNKKKWFPSVGVRIEIQGNLNNQDTIFHVFVPFIPACGSHVVHASFIPTKRGWFEIKNVKALTRFPFGLLKKWWTLIRNESEHQSYGDFSQGFFVFPQAEIIDKEILNWSFSAHQNEEGGIEKGDGAAVYGVRDYQWSDSPRHIHWRASAKRSTMADSNGTPWLVREMERDQSRKIGLILPSPQEIENLSLEEQERLVRCAAAFIDLFEKDLWQGRILIPAFQNLSSYEEMKFSGPQEFHEIRKFLSLWKPSDYTADFIKLILEDSLHSVPLNVPGSGIPLLQVFEKMRKQGNL